MNEQHPSISKAIVQSISQLWETHEFTDFKVKVDKEIFPFHSLILASCSDFFSGLLRSDMREKKEMAVELKHIASPIFQIILKTLYTGCELLTKENVLEVWSTVHQLQIQFLIEHCEDFVMANLSFDTVDSYGYCAGYLQSKKVSEYILNFISKNFEAFRKTKALLELEFQNLLDIIENDQLKVSSEDDVLHSIYDWVTFKSKEHTHSRGPMLKLLLKSTRYCLASESCIIKLYENKLTQNDTKVKDILFQALSFKSSGYYHGFCPTSAIHRDCSSFGHFGVYCVNNRVEAQSLKGNNTCTLPTLPVSGACTFTVYHGELYACIRSYRPICSQVFKLQDNVWTRVIDVNKDCHCFLSVGKYIYCLRHELLNMTRFNPKNSNIEIERFCCNEIRRPNYAFGFDNNIVVFCSVYNNGEDETVVHSWNTETQVWTELDKFKWSSKNMTSFFCDRDKYILFSNGNLLKMTKSEVIEFTFIARLWREILDIKGAVLFNKILFLALKSSNRLNVMSKLKGVYSSTKPLFLPNITSNCIHCVLPKD